MYSPEVLRAMNEKISAEYHANAAKRAARLQRELAAIRAGQAPTTTRVTASL